VYNAIGTMTGVQPSGQTRTGQDGKPIAIINPIYGQTFQWNDCVATIASQQYAAPFFSSTLSVLESNSICQRESIWGQSQLAFQFDNLGSGEYVY